MPLNSLQMEKLLSKYKETTIVTVSIDRFGLSKIAKAGALLGALLKGSRTESNQ